MLCTQTTCTAAAAHNPPFKNACWCRPACLVVSCPSPIFFACLCSPKEILIESKRATKNLQTQRSTLSQKQLKNDKVWTSAFAGFFLHDSIPCWIFFKDIPSKWTRHHKTCRTRPACIFEGGVMGSCPSASGLGAKHLNEDGTTVVKSDITAMARCEIKLIHLQLH